MRVTSDREKLGMGPVTCPVVYCWGGEEVGGW